MSPHDVRVESTAGAGQLITETFDYDGGRTVTVYVPPTPPEAVVFAGDGHLVAEWRADLEQIVPATMIVGVHRHVDDRLRLEEYSPAFDPQRFAAHAEFFADEIPRWTSSHFGLALSPERTAVLGVSASAELALALGLRRPDLYGVALAASPGAGYRPPDGLTEPLPRTYLVAGTQEPFFRDNATRWATALRDAGGDVVLAERTGSHGDPFWRAELPRMVAWAFAR